MQRVTEYLRQLAPGVDDVTRQVVGPLEGLEFRQRVAGQKRPWRFAATNMSDGTLRGLGVLVALLQANGRRPSLVAIEEPEVALHPAALGVLVDAIRDAAIQTQVLATSHSPELLDRPGIGPDELLAVEAVDGLTTIGRVDSASIEALRSRLFTAGELLRLDQLEPSAAARQAAEVDALPLFGL
jgi:predicted ATPase